MLRRVIPYLKKQSGIVFEPEYQAVLDYAIANSITTPDLTTNIRNNLRVKNLKDISVFSNYDLLYIFDNPSGLGDFSKINYVNPSSNYLNNPNPSLEPSFIANSGFKSDGTKWFTTDYNPRTDRINVTQTDLMFMYQGFDFIADATGEAITGCRTANNTEQVYMQKQNATQGLFRIKQANAAQTFTISNFNKCIIHSSLTTGIRTYVDGIDTLANTVASASDYASLDLYVFALNNAGTAIAPMKSGLKYYGVAKGIGTGTTNPTAVSISQIMQDIY
jgi:hypothetical protein